MTYKKAISTLYLFLVLFCFVLIYITAKLMFAYHTDGYHNGFFINGWSDMVVNFNVSTGRWAQGLTNDYRFYTNRTLVTVINNLLFFGSLYFLIKQLFREYVLIITAVIYFSIFYNFLLPTDLRYFTHTLSTSLSYTLGTSLIFLFFGIYFKNINKVKPAIIILSVLLLLFITGLVEYLFVFLILLFGYILIEETLISLNNKHFRLSKINLIYFFVSIIGALVVVFSPGSMKRRNNTAEQLKISDLGEGFNYDKYFESLFEVISSYLNLNNLILLFFFIVIFSHIKTNNNVFFNRKNLKHKTILLLVFTLGLIFVPITVSFIASNGQIGMPKAHNFTCLTFIFFVIIVAFSFNVFYNVKVKKIASNLTLISPFLFFAYSYYSQGNNLYFQQHQIFSGNLLQANEEIFARRQYLLETNSIYSEKVIPTLSQNYKGKTFGYDNEKVKHKYYNKAFNNSIPVFTSQSIPKPREFTSMFLAQNNKIQPIYSNGNYRVYYNKKLHTLILENIQSLFNTPLKRFHIYIITENGNEEEYELNLENEMKKNKSFYIQNPKFVALVVPSSTKKIEIPELKDCILDLQDSFIKPKTEYKVGYGNIMR